MEVLEAGWAKHKVSNGRSPSSGTYCCRLYKVYAGNSTHYAYNYGGSLLQQTSSHLGLIKV